MAASRWIDRTQPQTLLMATIILYINAALDIVGGYLTALFPFGLLIVAAQVAIAIGIAHSKKLAYWGGVVFAVLGLAFVLVHFSAAALLSILFWGALVALLLHPQSRAYRAAWFR